MKTDISKKFIQRARRSIPGGVNSPVRSGKGMLVDPIIVQYAQGSKIFDMDGNQYIDYIASYGPLILGHAHPSVVAALHQAASKGTSFGCTCDQEIILCEMLCDAFPSIDQVRLVNSGTEATMTAIRLARAYTERDIIVKFEGCYHGHADAFLTQGGSGLLTHQIASSLGITQAVVQNTITCQFNDIDSVKKVFEQFPDKIAAVIVEPFPANMGLILPQDEFLPRLRRLTKEYGSLLIFDEVISGFRFSYGGIQNLWDLKPDLTTLGKIIGGGLPVGAYGGREDIMQMVAPQGKVYQAGTLSGNPLAVAAGIETLKILQSPELYEDIDLTTQQLTFALNTILTDKNISHWINQSGSVFSIFYTSRKVKNYQDVLTTDVDCFKMIYKNLLEQGILLPPSPYEVCFVSHAHTQKDINDTLIGWERSVS